MIESDSGMRTVGDRNADVRASCVYLFVRSHCMLGNIRQDKKINRENK
jgi:hypothetical protein